MKMHTEHEDSPDECHMCEVMVPKALSIWKDKRVHLIAVSASLLAIGLFFEFAMKEHLLAEAIFIVVTVVSGYKIAIESFSSLRRKRVSIGFLMIIAAVGAFLIGHGEEGATVIFLFYIAEFLEGYAAERSRRSIGSLLRAVPEVATVRRKGKEVEVHVHNVDIDEVVIVRPGEKIPLDGVVQKGFSSVNQAPITGESIPVAKQAGDKVFAGTINNEGFLEIKVTKRSDETMLSKIVKLVEKAQKRKSPTERFIDRFSKYYTPSVIILALLVMTVPTFMLGRPLDEWVYRGLVLLVVSCPCALAISTPVAMISAITSGARNGVLIKGSTYIEEIGKTKAFAFDKTGTLTEGRPEVTDIKTLSELPEREVLAIAASLEALSSHPIAKAVVRRAEEEGVKMKPIKEFRSVPGRGIMGRGSQEFYYVGCREAFEEAKIPFPKEKIIKLEEEGKTAVLIGSGKKIVGLIAVMDKIRNSAAKTVSGLKEIGLRTVMITGDGEKTAKAVAEKVGIDEYRSQLLPQDKVDVVKDLLREHGETAMVGDGVNDAPALAAANVGIAMGAIGSDVALETSDIALMQDDLSKLPYIIKLGKGTMRIVKQNILASILIKGSLAVLAFPGLVTLWLAVALGDMGLSLAVILNAMRLSFLKSK